MFKLLVVLSASLCVVYAAVVVRPLEPIPEKFKGQEGCYVEELDEVIPFGESKPSNTSCTLYGCRTEYLDVVACRPAVPRPTCKVVEDTEKPYPLCCQRVVCP